ncbi:unnamed protein product, partial [Mesorhabditis belari]|uniref:C-type lectin domain-containing protein n=1 Tax=Mesorhabditis belari TaxID=2138241 RepID=A0AAF3J9R7_9BILA
MHNFYFLFDFWLLLGTIFAYCPENSDYIDGLNACLLYSDSEITFQGAEEICKVYGGHLVSLSNAFENNIVASYGMKDLKAGQAYIGLSRQSAGAQWAWTDTMSVGYYKWASGQPAQQNCVILDVTEMAWRTVDCTLKAAYICKFDQLIPTSPGPSTTRATTLCPDGWKFWNKTGMCYGAGQEMTFDDAEAYCITFGGHLASVHSDEENDFIKSLTYNTSCDRNDANWFFGTTILGGQIYDRTNLTDYWTDGSPTNYTRTLCNVGSGPDGNTILMGAYPTTCWDCAEGNWGTSPFERSEVVYPNFVCKTAPNPLFR